MISRRTLLGTAGAAGLAAPFVAGSATAAVSPSVLPAPAASGIEHVVVVMMENRSFDHFLGWVPGARGRQAGMTFRDRYGVDHATHHLTYTASCSHADPDHSYEGGRIEYNRGACDGWLRAGDNDDLAIGYYLPADLPFFSKVAPAFTTCDAYFSAILAETYPNRFYQHSAQTDRTHNTMDIATMPTIWDRLADQGVSANYFFSDIPFLALYGTKYLPIAAPYAAFKAKAAAGQLPAVSFVDPAFNGESDGISGDDHPHGDIRAGEAFLADVYNTLVASPNWDKTVLVINFDEWGGFFDHVPPVSAPDLKSPHAMRGFRVPALVVSPLARRKFVAPWTYDHTSVLKMIEWRWGLDPLTPRDAAARNIAEVLDFAKPPNLAAPAVSVAPVVPVPCEVPSTPTAPSAESEWAGLAEMARAQGWTLP